MTIQINHTEYPAACRLKTSDALRFIIEDAKAALAANPDGEKAGYYADEINYAAMELQRRKSITSENSRTSTPWGQAQSVTRYGRGVNLYSCAGHGGFKVSKGLNAAMPECLRRADGWYEEDCDWARVVLAFPDRFDGDMIVQAENSLRNWSPDTYEALTGKTLKPGESRVKDEREWYAKHANSLIVVSAIRHEQPGTTKVWARAGGRHSPTGETRIFLVPSADYNAPRADGVFGFIINDTIHPEII